MKQLSENVIEIYPGEPIPEGSESAISILLLGSSDINGNAKYDWASKFCEALIEITDPQKGILQFQNLKFVIANGTIPPQNPVASIMNPEFCTKSEWIYQMIGTGPNSPQGSTGCDGIFVNFLKRSTASYPLFLFGLCATSGKLVARCDEQNVSYPFVFLTSKALNIPLLPGRVGSVLSVLQSFAIMIPKFQDATKYQLPE